MMIEARDLTKRYGDKLAVDHLSFTVEPGRVTGFLGPNGAGKSTTMRLILALDHPLAGTATIGGRRYADLPEPLRVVGALLEARAMHPGRSAYDHLLFLAQSQGLPRSRVDEVLALVGLTEAARKRTGGYSLGMSQRVGIAAALLGDPQVLILDEPVNGLDPEGILWIRNLMKQLASEGRTVFVSSHLMNEMAVTADHLIVIGKGKLIAESTTQEFIERSSEKSVLVRSPDAIRPWQYVLEPLCGYIELAEQLIISGAPVCEAWNFGPHDHDARPVAWLVAQLTRLWGENAKWRVDAAAHPHEAHYLKLDISKARARLNWSPRWSLMEALEKVVEWYRAQRDGQDMRNVCLAQIEAYERAGV